MASEITVSSSTDTQKAVDEAARYGSKSATTEAEKAEPKESEVAQEAETEAEPETATEESSKEEPEEEGEESEVVGKTRRKLLRQVSRLNSRNITLQEQLEEARERLRKAEEGAGGKPPSPAQQGKPDPKDAKYKGRPYEEYVEDLADWKLSQREVAKAQAEQDQYVRQVFDDYNQQVEQMRDKYDDFDEVLGKDNVPVPMIAINAMYEMSNGAEVAYYIAKHPELREQLLEWNEPNTRGGIRRIIVELDRISEQLGGTSASRSKNNGSPKPRPVTAAPAPIKPLGGASASRSTADPDKMDYQTYKRWHEKTYGTRR